MLGGRPCSYQLVCRFLSPFVSRLVIDHGGPLFIYGKTGEQKYEDFTIALRRDVPIYAWLVDMELQKVLLPGSN